MDRLDRRIDIVAKEHGQVGAQVVRELNRVLNVVNLGERVEVKVAENGNPETVQRRWQFGEMRGDTLKRQPLRLNERAVGNAAEPDRDPGKAILQECSPCEFHKQVKAPNDPNISATAATRRADCNFDAMPPIAAARVRHFRRLA